MIQHSTSTFHKILISTGLHANGIQLPIHIPGDYTTKSPAELWDQVPEAGKWQIVLFVGFLEFFSESGAGGAHYTKGGKPGAFPSFNSPEAGDQFKIPHPVPLDLWHNSVQKSNRHDTPSTRRQLHDTRRTAPDSLLIYAQGPGRLHEERLPREEGARPPHRDQQRPPRHARPLRLPLRVEGPGLRARARRHRAAVRRRLHGPVRRRLPHLLSA